MIEVAAHADGCVLAVRAQPGARRNAVVGEQNGALKVAVTAPPERGRANQAIADLLADALGLRKAQIELIGGASSRAKRFVVRGITAEQLRERLTSLTGPLE